MAQLSLSGSGNAFKRDDPNSRQRYVLDSDSDSFTIRNNNPQYASTSHLKSQHSPLHFSRQSHFQQQPQQQQPQRPSARAESVASSFLFPAPQPPVLPPERQSIQSVAACSPEPRTSIAGGPASQENSARRLSATSGKSTAERESNTGRESVVVIKDEALVAIETEEKRTAQPVVIDGKKVQEEVELLKFQEYIDLMDGVVKTSVRTANLSKDKLISLKSDIYDIREAFAKVDLERRLRAFRAKMEEVKDQITNGIKIDGTAIMSGLNGTTIMEVVDLCDKILDAQGSCEPDYVHLENACSSPPGNNIPGWLWLPVWAIGCVYRAITPKEWRRYFMESGWRHILALNEDDLIDADMGLNAMGIICALVMTVPFGILGAFNPQSFDELRAAIATCRGRWEDPATGIVYPCTDFGWTYQGVRVEFLCYISLCIFSSLNSVILSTIYYVFHRGGTKDPRLLHKWYMEKGYLIVLLCGLCTILAVGALCGLTKTIFVYFSNSLAPVPVLLKTWWPGQDVNMTQPYVSSSNDIPVSSGTTPFVSDVCSTNSYQFAVPGIMSLVASVVIGLHLVC